MTSSRPRRAAALATALLLASTAFASAGSAQGAAAVPADAPSGSTAGPENGTSLKQASAGRDEKAAGDALARVRTLFTPSATARAARATGGVDVTMALRDLAARYNALSESDRAAADGYLARPTGTNDGDSFTVEYGIPEATPVCTADLCVHYVTGANANGDAPPPADTQDAGGAAGANGIPDYVDTVVRVMTTVHDAYLRAGYREPLPDGTRGGDDRIDVYLAEIGNRGAYGYCTTDQPDPVKGPQHFDRWAYCVLDNDYARFPNSALENIQVTAAHEYFHATQYAYDAYEDQWFLEATATWAEDEVYDGVNDNVQYLRRSPLTAPFVPLDSFVGNGDYAGFHYGSWSFFRFLTEKYGARKGGMPRLVLDLMKKVDASIGAQDFYSWQAIAAVLKAKKTTPARQFLAYSVANRRPRDTYDEGRAQGYPTGPLSGSVALTPKRRRAGLATVTTDHLTSATYRLTPRHLKRPRTKLKVSLDMAARKRGSMAAVTVVPKKGKVTVHRVRLDRRGNGAKAVPFSSRRVSYVEVTLANTSARSSRCYQQYTPWSCYGLPKDDGLKQRISARVVG